MKRIINFIFGSGLQNKFVLLFLLLASVPILIVGSIALYAIDLSHRHDVSNLELALLDEKTRETEKFFADTLGIIELRVGFAQKSEIALSEQEFLLDGILEENSAFEEIRFVSLDGLETAKKAKYSVAGLSDVSELPAFRKARLGETFIGEVYYTLSGPFISIASPVTNRSGDIIQVLIAEVSIKELIDSVDASQIGSAGYLFLVDTNGSLISRGREGRIAQGSDLSGSSRIRDVLGGVLFDALGERDRYLGILSGIPVIGAGKKIAKTGWAIIAEWPIEDADALLRDIRALVLRISLVAILAVFLLAPLFARRLLGPIRALGEKAEEVSRGRFDARVDIKTKDELAGLGATFNKMSEGLKRLQELKDEFIFIAAHELRSPVTVIRGYISMALQGDGGAIPPAAKEFLAEADRANQRLVQLVADLLEVARSEAGRISISVAPIDIKEPIRASLKELRPLADEKGMAIAYDPPRELPNVFADANRMKEIVVNLVGNAIKYTPRGGAIEVSHEAQGNAWIVTHVKDNGFGIARDAQAKIFEKFYRVQTKQTEEITGTGLGLFIVKQIVEKMGGKIWFESEEGKGSTFSFSLPIARA